jgi:BMFP domain-containing protein YqiC
MTNRASVTRAESEALVERVEDLEDALTPERAAAASGAMTFHRAR